MVRKCSFQIANAKPGTFSWLNYKKSDLWAVGAIAYEIFNIDNPFYDKTMKLLSKSYKEEDLPELPDTIPFIIRNLVSNMLSRSTNKVTKKKKKKEENVIR